MSLKLYSHNNTTSVDLDFKDIVFQKRSNGLDILQIVFEKMPSVLEYSNIVEYNNQKYKIVEMKANLATARLFVDNIYSLEIDFEDIGSSSISLEKRVAQILFEKGWDFKFDESIVTVDETDYKNLEKANIKEALDYIRIKKFYNNVVYNIDNDAKTIVMVYKPHGNVTDVTLTTETRSKINKFIKNVSTDYATALIPVNKYTSLDENKILKSDRYMKYPKELTWYSPYYFNNLVLYSIANKYILSDILNKHEKYRIPKSVLPNNITVGDVISLEIIPKWAVKFRVSEEYDYFSDITKNEFILSNRLFNDTSVSCLLDSDNSNVLDYIGDNVPQPIIIVDSNNTEFALKDHNHDKTYSKINHSHDLATDYQDGFMSINDKTTLTKIDESVKIKNPVFCIGSYAKPGPQPLLLNIPYNSKLIGIESVINEFDTISDILLQKIDLESYRSNKEDSWLTVGNITTNKYTKQENLDISISRNDLFRLVISDKCGKLRGINIILTIKMD